MSRGTGKNASEQVNPTFLLRGIDHAAVTKRYDEGFYSIYVRRRSNFVFNQREKLFAPTYSAKWEDPVYAFYDKKDSQIVIFTTDQEELERCCDRREEQTIPDRREEQTISDRGEGAEERTCDPLHDRPEPDPTGQRVCFRCKRLYTGRPWGIPIRMEVVDTPMGQKIGFWSTDFHYCTKDCAYTKALKYFHAPAKGRRIQYRDSATFLKILNRELGGEELKIVPDPRLHKIHGGSQDQEEFQKNRTHASCPNFDFLTAKRKYMVSE